MTGVSPRPDERANTDRRVCKIQSDSWFGQKPRLSLIRAAGDMSLGAVRCQCGTCKWAWSVLSESATALPSSRSGMLWSATWLRRRSFSSPSRLWMCDFVVARLMFSRRATSLSLGSVLIHSAACRSRLLSVGAGKGALRPVHVIQHTRLLLFCPQSRARRRGGRSRHSSRRCQTRASRFRNIDIRARSRTGGDPGETLFGLDAREHPYFAGYQEANRFYRKPDPADIGDNRDPLAARSMLQPKVEIVPRGTGKSGVELVIETDLVVPFKGFLDCRHQDVAAILHCHSSAGSDADNILGKAFDEFEHRHLP